MNKVYWCLVFVLYLNNLLGQPARIYVNHAAKGIKTGQSWVDAIPDLSDALQQAQAGDSIWVAYGTYKPSSTNDRWATFTVPAGVCLFGGFSGVESEITQRDWALNPTVLSGDIGISEDSSDNCYNIVFLQNPDNNTQIDGFTFRFGNANNNNEFLPTRDRSKCGGAIYINGQDGQAYADIRNCRFEYNSALNHGGAVYVNGSGSGSVAPTFRDCILEYNRAGLDGGGIARSGGSWIERSPDLERCTFAHNYAGRNGGGLYVSDSERSDALDLLRCMFYQNLANSSGGGAYIRVGRSGTGSAVKIDSCSFDDNNIASFDGMLALDIYGSTSFVNKILLSNTNFVNHQNSLPSNSRQGIVRIVGIDNESLPSAWASSVQNCRFENNSAGPAGDIFYYEHGPDLSVNFSKITFRNNSGANIFFQSNSKRAELNRFILRDNSARLLVNQTNVDTSYISNSEFSDNSIADNSNLLIGLKTNFTSLTNITIVNNTRNVSVPYQAPVINTLAVSNSIFSGNSSPNFLLNAAKTITIEYSYFDSLNCAAAPNGIICGPGIITSTDPQFVAPDSGDYRLQACSPLLNAGANSAIGSSSVDLAGHPRIAQGTVDIGAYEASGPRVGMPPAIQASCPGGASGIVEPDILDACPPLSYHWQSGANSGDALQNLVAGMYSVTATDSKGQTAVFSTTVPEGMSLTLHPIHTPVICGDTLGGSASASLSNGLAPFYYQWADGNTDSLRSGLAAGAYPVTVTDANGCSTTGAVEVEPSGNLSVDIDLGAISCHGAADGSFTITPANGKAPFTWHWENGANTPNLAPIGPGAYLGTLTDALGCSIGWILPMSEPDILALHPLVTPVSDSSLADGQIQLQPTGGTGPFEALWSTGAGGLSIDSLLVGFYSVTLTDAHDCTATETVSVGVTSAAPEASEMQRGIQVFPNPATNTVSVMFIQPALAGAKYLRIRNIAGQLLREIHLQPDQPGLIISVGNWPRGVYVLQTEYGQQKLVLH